jgi:hypothetical protein
MRRVVLAVLALAALLPGWTESAGAQTSSGTPATIPSVGDSSPTPRDPQRAAEAGQQAGPPGGAAPAIAGEGPGTSPSPAPPGAGASNPPSFATFRVYATQYDPNTPGSSEVAVPDKCAKFAALKLTSALSSSGCSSGYRLDLDYRVVVSRDNGRSATFPVKDVGPWNEDDNYWAGPGSTRPRRRFADVPRGTPESQAAFYNGYNTQTNCTSLSTGQPAGKPAGADQFGRCVLNPAGIDLSVEAAKALGLGTFENTWVTVSFLWEPTDTTVSVGHTGKNLDINYVSRDPGAQAIQWPANGGRNQAWRFIPTNTPGVYNIQVQHSGMMLDVEGVSTDNGARVIQWPANGGVNQQWKLVPVGTTGAFNIVAQFSGKLLDVAGASRDDGALIIQWPANGGLNQQWKPAVSGL